MSDIVRNLISIADASRRPDGEDIPLGKQLRQAAEEIERLRTTTMIECSRYAYERDMARRERDDVIAQRLEQVGIVNEAGDHIDVAIDEDLLWAVGEKLYRFRDGAA